MTAQEVDESFVNYNETFGVYTNGMNSKVRDVRLLNNLGKPSDDNFSRLCGAFIKSRKRLVVSGIKQIEKWRDMFNDLSVVYYDIDDNTVVFDRYE